MHLLSVKIGKKAGWFSIFIVGALSGKGYILEVNYMTLYSVTFKNDKKENIDNEILTCILHFQNSQLKIKINVLFYTVNIGCTL